MMNKTFYIFFITMLFSCGTYRETKHGYTIKGSAEIVFDATDKKLNGRSLITGYVYSRSTQDFPENAEILIGMKSTLTDKNGFFSLIVEPGSYDISTNYVGNIKEKLEQIELKKDHRIIVVFQLGTSALY